jgi:LacI family transcriptional regulator
MLAGISAEAESMGVRVVLRHAASMDPDEPIDPSRFVDSDQVGAILIGRFGAIGSQSLAGRFPCVTIAHQDESGKIDCVDQDNLQATSLLMQHLKSLGHRKIAFLGGASARHSYRERLAGFVAEMALAGQVDPSLILNVEPQPQSAASTTESLSGALAALIRQGVTAAICVHDDLAYQVAGVLEKAHGIVVPRDVSLVGFDSLPTPTGMPVMTSITSPFEQMGALAVRRLLQRVRAPETPAIRVVFSCTLRHGASVAPVSVGSAASVNGEKPKHR